MATPPSECLKLMLHRVASRRGQKLLYTDVSRAYLYALAVRPVYVQLPDEDRGTGDDAMCGKLRVSMYGTRSSASYEFSMRNANKRAPGSDAFSNLLANSLALSCIARRSCIGVSGLKDKRLVSPTCARVHTRVSPTCAQDKRQPLQS